MNEQAEHSEDEAAAEALRAAFRVQSDEPEPESAPEQQDAGATRDQAAEDSEQPEPARAEEQPQPESDDQPTDDVEAMRAEHQKQLAEIREQAARSVEWAKGLGLKKASELATFKQRAADLMARIKRGEEVDQSELEALTSGAQPVAQAQPTPFAPPATAPTLTDEQQLDLAQFKLETGLSDEQVLERWQWMQTPGNLSPRDAAVADLYGLLSIGNMRYEKAHAASNPTNAKAVKAAVRAQKAAAKAASAAPGRSGPASPPDKSPPDIASLPDDERNEVLGKLMRQMVEQG